MNSVVGCFTNRCSITMINTNRTKVRTTLTTTELNYGATVFAVGVSTIKGYPYGPSVKKATGKRLIHRVSTLNNRVKGATSRYFLRSEVLGEKGNPTIRSLETRVSEEGCSSIVGRGVRLRGGLSLHRTRVASVRGARNNCGLAAEVLTMFGYGAIVVTANACLNKEVFINRISCRDNPSKVFPTTFLNSDLGGLNLPLEEFGANAPTEILGDSVSFSRLRIRGNSRPPRPFSCRARGLNRGGIRYRID